ncbi:MAG: DUF7487 domain-containing protein [bacterium]
MYIKKRNNKIAKVILENDKLKSELKIGQRDTLIFTCECCNKEASKRVSFFSSFKKEEFICSSCKRKQTNQEKYGGNAPTSSKEIQEKIRQTNLERYGVENPSQRKEIQEKRKQTNQEKYGGNSPASSKEILKKIQKTNLERYGIKTKLQLKEEREKGKEKAILNSKTSILKKFGVSSNLERKDILKKIQKTNLERYGVEKSFQSKTIQEKAKFSIQKFIQENSLTIKEFSNLLLKKDIIILNSLKENDYNQTLNSWLQNNNLILSSYKNKKYTIKTYSGAIKTNGGSSNTSVAEKEIKDFITSLNIKVIENDRTILNGKEIDIYLPDYNLGIEYNGFFWHNKNFDYHFNKTKEAKEKGIHLIHVFEDEWRDKKEIVKSRIKAKLGIFDEKIYARKCIIKETNYTETKKFLNENHIQGNAKGSIKLGLYYNNELVSLMTFSKLRKSLGYNSEEGFFELLRFCNKLNSTVLGGASKLFKYFTKNYNYKKVLSYSSNDWNTGSVYSKIGFSFIKETKPNYFYIKNKKRFNRFKFRKSELHKYFSNIKNKTEKEIMQENGYNRIYNSGNMLWEYVNDGAKNCLSYKQKIAP